VDVSASAKRRSCSPRPPLPPMLRISAPMSDASSAAETTTLKGELTPKSPESGAAWWSAVRPDTGDSSRNASRATLVRRWKSPAAPSVHQLYRSSPAPVRGQYAPETRARRGSDASLPSRQSRRNDENDWERSGT
jgi:hypothetical protein